MREFGRRREVKEIREEKKKFADCPLMNPTSADEIERQKRILRDIKTHTPEQLDAMYDRPLADFI